MVAVEDFRSVGEGFLLVEQFSHAAHYRLWQSSTPTGPELSTPTNIVYTVYDQMGDHRLEANSLGTGP